MNFDWEKNWDYARRCIAGVMEKSHINNADIVAVSTTCMREGIILYDKTGKEIWACANVDARSTDEVVQLKKSRFPLNMNSTLRPDKRIRSVRCRVSFG